MPREKIANFLTAERKVSPLMAFSLLIVAGFIAGSLQVVAPVSENAMVAVAVGATDSSLDSEAPKDCTAAIKAALGKSIGPSATTVGQGESGTADACFGGILKPGNKPSDNPADYECVGRSGRVTITTGSAITTTIPDKSVEPGKCKVQVCQPITTIVDGKPVVNPNCGEPKQFSAGQSVTPQSGGVPSLPSIPSGGGGGSATPTPNTPSPNENTGSCPGSPGCPGNPTPVTPTEPNAADQIKSISCSGSPDCPLGPGTAGTLPGTQTPGADTAAFSPGAQTNPYLNGTYTELPATSPVAPGNDPNSLTPAQTTTFSPGAESNPYLNGTYQPNSDATNDSNSLTPPSGGAFSPGALSNPWLNGSIPADTRSVNSPDSLTPPPALDPGVQDLRGWSPGAASNPYLNSTINPESRAGEDANSLTPAFQNNGAETNPYLNGKNKPDGSTANAPDAITPTFKPDGSPAARPPAQQPPPGGGGGGNGGNGGGGSGGGGSSSGGSGAAKGLMSMLGGLMKGLGGSGNQQPAQSCPTDPQRYQQYQQQYQQQLQQYNYQLQQYNYQAQQNAQYGYTSYGTPPQPPQPCSSGGAGQCPQLAARPDPATCPLGTWRQMTTAQGAGSVCPVWQCVTGSGTTPTAQLSCLPGVAEAGTQIAISYTCSNATKSTGYGFETNGATAGATTTTIGEIPANAGGINYAIKCENGAISSGAQCSVQFGKISITLRAVPEVTRVGESALIGWVTSGMESCTVSSPDQPDFTARNVGVKSVSGIATSSPILEETDFYLNCKTLTGSTREEIVTVEAYRPGAVSTSIETRTNVVRGTRATIQWNFPDAPDVSAVALWLYSVEDKQSVALITGHRAKAGSYAWDIPTESEPCNTSSSIVCGSDLIPGRTYQILASLYTPPSAGLGEYEDASLPDPQFLDNPMSKSFKIAQ